MDERKQKEGAPPAQSKRLAQEARNLAMECLNGAAPVFKSWTFQFCAIGEVLAREGERPDSRERYALAIKLDNLSEGLVSHALIGTRHGTIVGVTPHEALVFPLLFLADALTDAAEPQ